MSTLEQFGRFCFDGIKTIEKESCHVRCLWIHDWTTAHIILQSTYHLWIWITAKWCVLSAYECWSFWIVYQRSGRSGREVFAFANFCWETFFLWHLSNGFAVLVVSHSVSRIFSVCQVREVFCRKLMAFTMTSFLISIVVIQPNKHCGVNA